MNDKLRTDELMLFIVDKMNLEAESISTCKNNILMKLLSFVPRDCYYISFILFY